MHWNVESLQMRLKQVLDLKGWHKRNLAVGYGTRDKIVLKQSARGKVYYLAKSYDKDIGELRSEVCASAIGRLLGFPVQTTWLCKIPQHNSLGLKHSHGVLIQLNVRRQRDTRRGQFREDLKHGAALISLVHKRFSSLKDEKARRTRYTLDLVVAAIRNYVRNHPGSEKIWDQFFQLLAFDALIGGTDRHYNNWGVLEKADNGAFLRLAPAFDNGVSLMWKLEEYRGQFLRDLHQKNFPRRAASMFKKRGGGKYTLFTVLEALHKKGDYKTSTVAHDLLARLRTVREHQIRWMLLKNVPQSAEFKTSKEELQVVSLYANARLSLLIETLAKITSS